MTEPTLTVRFFARLREELETESLTLPASDEQTVDDLLTSLASRGGRWTGDQRQNLSLCIDVGKRRSDVKSWVRLLREDLRRGACLVAGDRKGQGDRANGRPRFRCQDFHVALLLSARRCGSFFPRPDSAPV